MRSAVHAFNSPGIRYFQVLAQTGSFRRAAEEIGIAASAIHRQVGLLETQFGTRLFERGRGREGVKLTPAGELLLYRVRLATQEMRTAVAEIESIRGRTSGRVCMAATDALARGVVPALLTDLRRLQPGIELDVQVLDKAPIVEALVEGRVDLALLLNAPSRLGLRTRAEFQLATAAVVSTVHPLAGKASTTLAECAQYPLAVYADPQVTGDLLGRMKREGKVKPEVVLTTNSYVLMRDVAAAGLGVSIQTMLPSRFRPADSNIVYVPIRASLARYSVLSLCVHADRRLSAAASFISDLLSDVLAHPAGEADRTNIGASTS